MSQKRLSIVDIANQLNISKTTVSFILNGRAQEKRISAELIDKVQKFVKEVGYKPNSLAKSLRTGKSNIIGLMVEDISNPFFSSIARLIEDRAYKNGYKIIYCSTYNDTEKTKDLIGIFRDRHVDGYIIAPPEGIEKEVTALINDNFPVVLFDRYLPDVDTDHVVVNNLFSAYNVTKHLIEQGRKNVALLTFASNQSQMQDRAEGYTMAIKESNLTPLIEELKFNQNANLLVEPITNFFKKAKNIDAIVFGTNHLGTCSLKVINSLGIKIPDDIAVVSFDDSDVYELHSPPITAISQPIENIADKLIVTLLERLNPTKNNKTLYQTTLDTELIIRGSSKVKHNS